MADASAKLPHPHRVRLAAEHIRLSWVEGVSELATLVGKTRHHTAMQVLQAVLNAVQEKTLATNIVVEELARRCGLRPRTVGKKLKAFSILGWFKRTNRGPAPWLLEVDHQRLMKVGLAHRDRADKERGRPIRAKGEGEPASARPAGDGSGDASPAKSTEPRRPRHPAGRGSRVLASLLWNVSPWRPEGSQELAADTVWPEPVLDIPPCELAQILDLYFAACALGAPKWNNKPVSQSDFIKHVWEARQWHHAPRNTSQPSLGRPLRDEWERKLYEQGRREWVPPALPSRGPGDARTQLLEPWLRPLYDRERFPEKLYALLEQGTGPPPDWLPEELRPRWGQLRIFTVAH